MTWRRSLTPWHPFGRKLCSGVVLLSYLTTILGLPLPAAPRKEDSSSAPGRRQACGCQIVEPCQGSCCCGTGRHASSCGSGADVEPAAEEQPPAPPPPQPTRASQRRPGHSCCAVAPTAETSPGGSGPCCGGAPPSPTATHKPPQTTKVSTKPAKLNPVGDGQLRWVLGVSALRCQGQSTLWVTSGAVLPPPPAVVWNPSLALVGWLSPANTTGCQLTIAPLDRPPRMF
jgi:hypothetical protein